VLGCMVTGNSVIRYFLEISHHLAWKLPISFGSINQHIQYFSYWFS
jgi:hypothetical protein